MADVKKNIAAYEKAFTEALDNRVGALSQTISADVRKQLAKLQETIIFQYLGVSNRWSKLEISDNDSIVRKFLDARLKAEANKFLEGLSVNIKDIPPKLKTRLEEVFWVEFERRMAHQLRLFAEREADKYAQTIGAELMKSLKE